jgi:hypothetical protein
MRQNRTSRAEMRFSGILRSFIKGNCSLQVGDRRGTYTYYSLEMEAAGRFQTGVISQNTEISSPCCENPTPQKTLIVEISLRILRGRSACQRSNSGLVTNTAPHHKTRVEVAELHRRGNFLAVSTARRSWCFICVFRHFRATQTGFT